jgi:hypothetical protein
VRYSPRSRQAESFPRQSAPLNHRATACDLRQQALRYVGNNGRLLSSE